MSRRRNRNYRPRQEHTHTHRHHSDAWMFVPVFIDARVDAGAAIGCVARLPDWFVEDLAAHMHRPAPEAMYLVNANRGPRNEDGADDRRGLCVDCCVDRWPDTAEAFRIAARDGVAVTDSAGGWIERTWEDFEVSGRYVEP